MLGVPGLRSLDLDDRGTTGGTSPSARASLRTPRTPVRTPRIGLTHAFGQPLPQPMDYPYQGLVYGETYSKKTVATAQDDDDDEDFDKLGAELHTNFPAEGLFHSKDVLGMPNCTFHLGTPLHSIKQNVFQTEKFGPYTLPAGVGTNGTRLQIPGFRFNKSGIDLPKLNLGAAAMHYVKIDPSRKNTDPVVMSPILTPRPGIMDKHHFHFTPRLNPLVANTKYEYYALTVPKFKNAPYVTPRDFVGTTKDLNFTTAETGVSTMATVPDVSTAATTEPEVPIEPAPTTRPARRRT
ncbi:unnamed protein product [Amoebophrya sp. A120]|nr:unnamed protein product [Amoebophrya sp. A120]|eukprot:GSA120T00012311001.1